MNIEDALKEFSEYLLEFQQGGKLIRPDPGYLSMRDPPIEKLHRDAHKIVIQHRSSDKAYADGGDSAHKTGILAFCNSTLDQKLLDMFLPQPGLPVRHPTQPPFNRWQNFSRDQLVAFMAGCWRARRTDIASAIFNRLERNGFFCLNTEVADDNHTQKAIGDILLPHDIMFLKICAGKAEAHADIAGQLSLQAMIEAYNIGTTTEKNQPLVQAIVCGRLDLFIHKHPQYADELRQYWGDREQDQIADALVMAAESERHRYRYKPPPGLLFPFLPVHLLHFMLTVDWAEELKHLSADSLRALSEKAFAAVVDDAREQVRELAATFASIANAITAGWTPLGIFGDVERESNAEPEPLLLPFVPEFYGKGLGLGLGMGLRKIV